MGSRYPSLKPVEVILSAAHDQQQEMEFAIGEIDTDAVAMIDVKYEDGEEVFVAQANTAATEIVPLAEPLIVRLDPPGLPGEDRLRALFSIDERRQLRLSVTDLKTQATMIHDTVIASLQ